MESDEEDGTNQGRYPGCGAIFMSSSSTKDECLRLRLFGLPSLQWPFVKRVKMGMILFLFEYEKRELHGVFQACSDGAMNIVPTAWSRSGKKFPAQVKVYPIWHCHSLPESEFGDAIKANYFSKLKFNFGLSKSQVWRLLMLFNMRKLKSPYHQRALARNTYAELMDPKEIDAELDDGLLSIDTVGNVHKVDNELQPRRRYLGQLPGKVEWDDARYGFDVHKVDNELQPRRRYLGQLPGQVEWDDARYGFDVHKVDNELQPQRRYLGQLPGKVEWDDARYGFDLEHGALSSIGHIGSSQNGRADGNLAMCGREGIVSHLEGPYYSGMPLQETFSVQDCDGQNRIPSSYPLAMCGREGIVNHLEGPYYSGMPLQETYSVQDCDGQNRIPSSYPLSPINYPSFLVDRGHPVAIQKKLVHEIGPSTANVTSLEELQCHSPCHYHSADLKSVDYHEGKCLNHKISDRMLCSDLEEQRGSVFSRLKSNTSGWCLESLSHEENVLYTPSVDEVMEMLSKSQDSWMRVEKSVVHSKRQGNVGKGWNVKQNPVKSELEMIPEKWNTDASPTGDKDDKSSKNTLFLDFKRWSRKVNNETNGESAGSEGLLVGQCKRRKLVRPNFSETEPCTDICKTGQMTVLELQTQPNTNSGRSDRISEFEGGRGSELEVLPVVEPCANTNASNVDERMVNNEQGITSEQLQASCNPDNRRSPQEDGSRTNLVENMEFGVNEDETVRENKRLWSILTSRLKHLRNDKEQ